MIKYLKSLKPDIDVLGKWACFGNAKTAQKSIMFGVLYDRQVRYRRGPRNWERVWEKIIVPNIDKVLLFTFVRNPWDRVVSAYHFLKNHNQVMGLDFDEYIKTAFVSKGPNINIHFKEQTPTFYYNGAFIPRMFIGRFENLQRDWATIAKIIDAPERLPHRNASKHKHYTEYYDEISRSIVARLYQQEIKLLGYKYGEN